MHRLHSERSDGFSSFPAGEPCPEVLVDDSLERSARASRLGLKPHGNIFIQSQGCSHSIKMLAHEHHDVHFDMRSFELNDEASLNVYDEQFAREMTAVFESDLKSSSRLGDRSRVLYERS